MKVDFKSAAEKKLVAVLFIGGDGFFFRTLSGGSTCIDRYGQQGQPSTLSLEELLSQDSSRKPIYEGDSITLTF